MQRKRRNLNIALEFVLFRGHVRTLFDLTTTDTSRTVPWGKH
jgi:hypothetical protein